jgi:hypothetical protein
MAGMIGTEGMAAAQHKGLREVLDDIAKSRGARAADLDMTKLVGETAGDIYKALDGKGEVPFHEVRQGLLDRGPIVMMAAGWLLREDKIALKIADKGIRVRLK